MNEINKLLGCVITDGSNRHRILHYQTGKVILCQMDVDTLELQYYDVNTLMQQLRNGIVSIEEIHENPIVNLDMLPDKEVANFKKKKALIAEISDEYGPSYIGLMGKERKDGVERIIQKHAISRNSFWKYIREYLQGGLNDFSLLDRRCAKLSAPNKGYSYTQKPGRRYIDRVATGVLSDEKVLAQYQRALEEFKKGRETTLKNAYLWLLNQYYSSTTSTGFPSLKPISERPTYRQFTYFCRKHITQEEIDIIKTSASEQRNAKRLLLGSSRTDALRPGWIVEADAVEIDCSIVSEMDSEQCVGRPILYVMIDVYSSAIVAFSISFENNSVLGLTNLMLNLTDDKIDFCNRFGIELGENIPWPSNFIPHEIRCDRGSDFKSDKFATICNRLDIKHTLEPGAMGSMKGIVEQCFHQFHTQLRSEIEKKGLITKRHDSNHHREAMLTLTDFTKLVITYIITHNVKAMENYPMEKDMYHDKSFLPTPIQIWNYGCIKHGSPRMIGHAQHDQYIFNLMEEKQATLSRKGIMLNGLVYYPENDPEILNEMIAAGNKRVKYSVRIDPRNVGTIYYLRNNQLIRAYLNPNIPGNTDFDGMTLAEYKEFSDKRQELKRKGKEYNMELDYGRTIINKAIIADADKPRYTSAKNMREARRLEKQRVNSQNSIETHLNPKKDIEQLVSGPQMAIKEPTPPVKEKYIPTGNMANAIEEFFDEEM